MSKTIRIMCQYFFIKLAAVTDILAYSKIKIDVLLEELRKKEIEERLERQKPSN